ncbi:MAG TPA: rRNA maturation RNase YbeY [Candidatus Acidoferrum sp.]|jgi:probable rRNA maturation factor|nr:rRNA maturation RNase YbeY [Candidatus Acidoferrum sp.]
MILNRQHEVRVALRPLESFLRRVERELGLKPSDVTVCLVSDAAMARLNENFRKRKGPTDVLSFPDVRRRKPVRLPRRMQASNSGGREYLGDIAISPATAWRYAKKLERPFSSELRVLILHGVLHLLGYDHETDRGEMDRMEQKLRKRFGLT